MRTTEDFERVELAGPADFSRAGRIESLVRRQEAVQRRLTSSLRQAELVDAALRVLDQQLADYGIEDDCLRATARAVLAVAYGRDGYDVTLTPAQCPFAVRIRHTPFGLETETVEIRHAPAAIHENPLCTGVGWPT